VWEDEEDENRDTEEEDNGSQQLEKFADFKEATEVWEWWPWLVIIALDLVHVGYRSSGGSSLLGPFFPFRLTLASIRQWGGFASAIVIGGLPTLLKPFVCCFFLSLLELFPLSLHSKPFCMLQGESGASTSNDDDPRMNRHATEGKEHPNFKYDLGMCVSSRYDIVG